MSGRNAILLFVSDGAVLSSLQFSLALEGFAVADGLAAPVPSTAVCLVVDQACRGDGLSLLAGLRTAGCTAPALLLATNPGRSLRHRAAATGAVIVEKPLLGEELTQALRTILDAKKEKAA